MRGFLRSGLDGPPFFDLTLLLSGEPNQWQALPRARVKGTNRIQAGGAELGRVA